MRLRQAPRYALPLYASLALIAVALALWALPALADDLTVANTSDAGKGSLREAIAQAKPEDTIVFDLPSRSPYADQRGLPRVGAPDVGAFEAQMGYVAWLPVPR